MNVFLNEVEGAEFDFGVYDRVEAVLILHVT